MNLYNQIYNAINEGVVKSLYIDDENSEDVTYSHSKVNTYLDPLQYEFIDLNLPSGTLWCTHNLGADCVGVPESWYGDYYAWGEAETKNEYNWKTYKWSDSEGKKLFKYNIDPEKGNVDNLAVLLPEDDIVQIKYSKIQNSKIAEKAMMPTKEQLDELLEYTKNKWIKNYKGIKGLNGRLFIGTNGNSIFIPAAGVFNGSELYLPGSGCYLWSSSLSSDNPNCAWILYFSSDSIEADRSSRYYGLSVRGVCS